MLDKGYAVATFSRLDIDPDTRDGFAKSLKSFYPELQNALLGRKPVKEALDEASRKVQRELRRA